WKDLTDNVNSMAGNLTEQVRGIAQVVTAVANGDLTRQLTFEAKGEIAELAGTINNMTATLATFADQVTNVAREVGIEGQLGGQANVPGAAGTWRDLTDNVNQLAANLTTQMRAIAAVATAVTNGDLSQSIRVEAQGEVEQLRDNINQMILNLRETTQQNREQDWLKTNLAKFSGMLQGQRDLQTVGRMILSELAPLVGVQRGVFYLAEQGEQEPQLRLLAGYAVERNGGAPATIDLGEGLVGQCAVERRRIILTNIPDGYSAINSGLGEATPRSIAVLPVLFEGEIKAVIELASYDKFADVHLSFLDQLTGIIGIVLNTLAANIRTQDLLKQSQALTNELRQTNGELQENARLLSEQNEEVERRRREIDEARAALEQKAEQLALTSRYKSQFLANMSHELRTPLNSLLILSQQLAENPDDNLSERQVSYARAIRDAGGDLLTLINDVLDLSKIESGTTAINVSRVSFADIREDMERTFRQVAQQKGLEFTIELDGALPPTLYTDPTRLQQVLKNLLSNAFKFTESGAVRMEVQPATAGWMEDNDTLRRAPGVVAFSVSDTGIGIPTDKQRVIFEAFQQADMDTSRRFGGTGLGLSISREIAGLLGGEFGLVSQPGAGSTFTLYLPLTFEMDRLESGQDALTGAPTHAEPVSDPTWTRGFDVTAEEEAAPYDDDRTAIEEGDHVVLVIARAADAAEPLVEAAHAREWKAVVALHSETGLTLARRYVPSAIVLDAGLPDLAGWKTLDVLKHDRDLQHVPVQLAGDLAERQVRRALDLGAVGILQRSGGADERDRALDDLFAFATRERRHLLIVEDDETQRLALADLLGGRGVEVVTVETGADALAAVEEETVDCVVLDLGLPDMSGLEVIEAMRANADRRIPPVVIYTGRDLRMEERVGLDGVSDEVIVKDAGSPERLLAATARLLHRADIDLPEAKRKVLRDFERRDPVLEGAHVLVVDDDMRNIFALSSALERYGIHVSYAENGRDGIERLHETPAIDAVLMDIMMPDMDGYETTQAIRSDGQFARLPIIALTAKAMKGDREKCIEAGCSDYITKPVNMQQLLSVLRVNMLAGELVAAGE
ncbi:MAG: response regulator, partial [Dehalococcoidia bacterium]